MVSGWKVIHISERKVIVETMNGDVVVVSPNSAQGYPFVQDYLKLLQKNYGKHLRAADILLQKIMGEQYKNLRVSERLYNIRLAMVSLSCAFGGAGEGMDCDESGELHFRFVKCPIRSICPVNGYNLKSRNGLACCNPIYETILTPRQLQLVDFLINTSYECEDIGSMMKIAKGRVRNMAHEIYAALNVSDRQELTLMLKGRRLE